MTTRKTGITGLPYERFRPLRHDYRPDFNPDGIAASPLDGEVADYNSVTMSEFKSNPSHYLLHSAHVPVVISRYGRLQGILMSIQAYNNLLARIRELRTALAETSNLLSQVNPALRGFVQTRLPEFESVSTAPRWPLIGSAPSRVRKPKVLSGAELDVFREEAAAYLESNAGAYRLPSAESEEDWGRFALIRPDSDSPDKLSPDLPPHRPADLEGFAPGFPNDVETWD